MVSRTNEINPVATFKEVLAEEKHNRKVYYNSKGVQIAVVDFYYEEENDIIPSRIEIRSPNDSGTLRTFNTVYEYFVFVRDLYRSSENRNIFQFIFNFFQSLFNR